MFSIETERTVAHGSTIVLQNCYFQLDKPASGISWPGARLRFASIAMLAPRCAGDHIC